MKLRFVSPLLISVLCAFSAAHAELPVGANALINRMYAETLGRAPDPSGYNGSVAHFNSNACGVETISTYVRGFFTSAEFTNLNLSNEEKVRRAYQAILQRDADPSGLQAQLNYLNTGAHISNVAGNIVASQEFKDRILPSICGTCDDKPVGFVQIDSSRPAVTTGRYSTQAPFSTRNPDGTTTYTCNTYVTRAQPAKTCTATAGAARPSWKDSLSPLPALPAGSMTYTSLVPICF